MKKKQIFLSLFLIIAFLSFPPFAPDVLAYIGPGAGIAFFSSFFIFVVTFLLAFFIILFWPLRFLYQCFKRKIKYRKYFDSNSHRKTKKVVVIGLDGLDPKLAEDFMQRGMLPNFSSLEKEGSFHQLRTTCPAISPVAWSSFSTGMTPAGHAIFDFFTRDAQTYLPILSSVDIQKGNGKMSGPKIKSLKKGRSFWEILGDCGISSSILRVPITFPPGKFNGRVLSAMCVPDLKGTQGTFSLYTTCDDFLKEHTGGVGFKVVKRGRKVQSFLYGPENPYEKGNPEIQLPFEVAYNNDSGSATLKVSGEIVVLKVGELSSWIQLSFSLKRRKKVTGICRFLLRSLEPHFTMYVTPININPGKPVLPISHPFVYAMYLSKVIGN